MQGGIMGPTAEAGGPAATATTAGGLADPDQPPTPSNDPAEETSTPRLILDLEGHRVVLTVQDLFLISIVLLLATDTVVSIAEVIR
ncbi:hypothetical protein [Halosegnis longus]|uniref:hypothetical protein n=1 Tax=Halosegnis longus TaxID=2216012 RepID=UPI00129DCD44|nr:hypothetical protein [Halosegnis longus]